MGNLKYLLLLALAATTVFASCSKDGDDDDKDPNADPREQYIGSYDITADIYAIDQQSNGMGDFVYDTTNETGVTYLATIVYPDAEDSLAADYLLLRNFDGPDDDNSERIHVTLADDVVIIDFSNNSDISGTGTFTGTTLNLEMEYSEAGDFRRYDITAVKRN